MNRQTLGKWRFAWIAVAVVAASASPARAADNELSPDEKAAGWQLLFDGRSLEGWQTSSQKPSQRPVEDGCLNPHRCGGYMLIHERVWSDFVLSLDFKISPRCNSGVFFRTFPLAPRPGKDVGFNGMELAIDDTQGRMRLGQMVTVVAETDIATTGIAAPRDAVIRGANGEDIVYVHTDPEVFEPRAVRTEPLDATRVLIVAGVAAGDRLVTQGAELLNQLR